LLIFCQHTLTLCWWHPVLGLRLSAVPSLRHCLSRFLCLCCVVVASARSNEVTIAGGYQVLLFAQGGIWRRGKCGKVKGLGRVVAWRKLVVGVSRRAVTCPAQFGLDQGWGDQRHFRPTQNFRVALHCPAQPHVICHVRRLAAMSAIMSGRRQLG
jgi:hypothetical protein